MRLSVEQRFLLASACVHAEDAIVYSHLLTQKPFIIKGVPDESEPDMIGTSATEY
ncbi:hypothetical protein DPMN_173772 [Dreissena polymorpha]|uniref:Uncharacterized protein n=1 Tax=Dreissena polymorpha TaxID=45954 RepID=A0A9D4E276_DREPO|nr:hypothetical protein DPMN_173772 [Dreissena polymorpha]